MRIDTEVPQVIVEIEDNEYVLAPRTVETCEKLMQVEKDNMGKPLYRLWLAELEIMLGKPACRTLFKDGRKENVDRLQMIYAGVAKAFYYTDEGLRTGAQEQKIESTMAALAPLVELFKSINRLEKANAQGNGEIREIRRG